MKPKILALYLPQFHPFPENDEWWGKGFTEWTNVGKAKSYFHGHNQPRVPADLGYYDLRLPIVREQQVELAREAGVTAFCYWHYWFGNGRRLLADVFQEVLDSGHPDFPFCLAWANHTWRAIGCTSDCTKSDKVLIEQTYPGLDDARMHFDFLLTAFRDKRYFTVGGKPYLFIFDPFSLPKEYIDHFRIWSKEAGLPGIYLVANASHWIPKEEMLKKGFDAVTYSNLTGRFPKKKPVELADKIYMRLKGIALRRPTYVYDYGKVSRKLIDDMDSDVHVIPQVVPQWDHSPRGGRKTIIYINSTPPNLKSC